MLDHDPETLGARLKRARIARGLSLDALSAQLDGLVTKAALSKYELGKATPRPTVLVALCKALRVRSTVLLSAAEEDAEITWLAYRRHVAIAPRMRKRVEARVAERVESQIVLEARLHPTNESSPLTSCSVSTPAEVEERARELRRTWELGDGPIEKLVPALEDRGVIVVEGPAASSFEAFSGRTASGSAVIVVHPAVPARALRLAVAHELGHLTMDTSAVTPSEEERLVTRFALAFLIPEATARRELGMRRKDLAIEELEHLARKYGVSMAMWTSRARELGILNEASFRSWQSLFHDSEWVVKESPPRYGDERPQRLHFLAVQAVREGLVDADWAATQGAGSTPRSGSSSTPIQALLAMPRKLRHEFIQQQSRRAAADYANDPEVLEWLAFDEPPEANPGSRA